MAFVQGGPFNWQLKVDEERHREYHITYLVAVLRGEGPAAAFNAPGLPQVGDYWVITDPNTGLTDIDLWAWCHPETEVVDALGGGNNDPTQYFHVTFKFSTKPLKKCSDQKIEDPLLEPMKVSGQTKVLNREYTRDRFGDPILNSAHEQIRGPTVEWQEAQPVIKVEQNVIDLDLPLLEALVNTVNDDILWGLSARCILFSSYSWEKKFHGLCNVYYTRSLEFTCATKILIEEGEDDDGNAYEESSIVSAHDRDILDEGTKVLNGKWNRTTGEWELINISGAPPDRDNPAHFIRYKDRNGENARVILNGIGEPAYARVRFDTGEGTSTVGQPIDPGKISVEAYRESNLLLLSIPIVL